MKTRHAKAGTPQADAAAPKVDRRGVVVGAGVVGAAALAGHALLQRRRGDPGRGRWRRRGGGSGGGLPAHAARPALLRNHEGVSRPSSQRPESIHVADAQNLRSRRGPVFGAGREPRARCPARDSDDGPSIVPAPLRPRPRRRSGDLAADAGAQGAGRRCTGGRRRQAGDPSHRLHALLGRLRGRCGRRERRLDAAGAGLRFAAQPRRPLRQGRGAARARPRRLPAEDADEAGRRQVPAHQLGPGAQRDQREDARAEEGERPGLGLRRRLVEAQQRAGVPAAQVGQLLGLATTATTRLASATPPRSRASRTRGATAR